MTTIRGDKISAVDLLNAGFFNSIKNNSKSSLFSNEELAYQEARRKRKVRKLNFEVR